MKLKFRSILLTSILAIAGIFGVGSALVNKQIEETPVAEKAEAGGTKTVYVDLNILSLSSCYVYIKNSDYTDNGWPGKHLSTLTNYGTVEAKYEDAGGVYRTKSFYKFDIDTTSREIAITNSNGSTYYGDKWDITSATDGNWNLAQLTGWKESYNYNQQHMHIVEIVDEESTTYELNPAEWGKYHIPTHSGTEMVFIGWYIDGDTDTTRFDDGGVYEMPMNNINDYNFTAVYDDTSYTVTFMSESGTTLDTQTIYKGKSASYSGPAKPDEGGKYYTFDAWRDSSGNDKTSALANVQSDLTVYASYTYAYRTGRYAVGVFGSCNWGVEGAGYMPKINENEYEGSITLSYTEGDKFKVAFYNGSGLSSYFGYYDIVSSCGAYHYFTNDFEDNIVCYARGTYTIYFTDSNYGEEGGREKKISIEVAGSLNAEHLAAQLMAFSASEGHCGDSERFPAMKTIFLGLDSSEKTIFQGYASSEIGQFSNAYNRYVAWASALGENPWAAGKVSNAIKNFSPLSLFGEDGINLSLVVIIVASSVALLSVTALSILVIKKRKQKEE